MDQTEKKSLKESFKNIRKEMFFLYEEILNLKEQISKTNKVVNYLSSYLKKHFSALGQSSTYSTIIQQNGKVPADNLQYKQEIEPISSISIGNEGVPADSQQTVSRQTIPKVLEIPKIKEFRDFNNVTEILDTLKKELREKFKNLTKQELMIFSVIYTLSEEREEVAYKDIALKAKLTESSVRDYISRLEHKGIPLIKEKKNNKLIIIKIPNELKNLSTLDNLTKLYRK